MTVSDFENYIKKGLGRALMLLRKEPDKSPYRKPLIDYYTKNTHFFRMISVYDAELIRCFPDADALAEEIAVTLFDEIRQGVKMQMVPMLTELGYGDTVTAIVEELYQAAYRDLLAHVQNGNPEEKHPLCAVQYTGAITGLSKLKASRERMKQVLFDIADLFQYSEEPPIPPILSPAFVIPGGLGAKTIQALMEEVAKEHPFGEKLLSHCFGPAPISLKPQYKVSKEQIFAAYEPGYTYDIAMHIAFVYADEDVTMAVAEELLRETDIDRRAYLMDFFCDPVPHIPGAVFPLDPTPLIEIAQALPLVPYKENARESGIVTTFYRFLSKVHHPDVKALGKKILADPKADFYQREQGAKMVFASNFEKEDTPAFLEYLQSASSQELWIVPCSALDKGIDLPLEVIECAFLLADNTRVSLVKKLLEKGKLPASLREECRYDANPYIRKLMDEI